jgi:hypothetical protein
MALTAPGANLGLFHFAPRIRKGLAMGQAALADVCGAFAAFAAFSRASLARVCDSFSCT